MHAELRKENIIVTTVYPGLMRTGTPRNAKFKSKHRKEYAWFSLSDSLPGISMNVSNARLDRSRAIARQDPGLDLADIHHCSTAFNDRDLPLRSHKNVEGTRARQLTAMDDHIFYFRMALAFDCARFANL